VNGFSSGGDLHSGLPAASVTAIAGAAQQAAIAVSSAWSALYFSFRLISRDAAAHDESSRARRVAAGILALLFAAIAVEALAGLPVASTPAEVARRVPLLLATVSVAFVVSYRPWGAR